MSGEVLAVINNSFCVGLCGAPHKPTQNELLITASTSPDIPVVDFCFTISWFPWQTLTATFVCAAQSYTKPASAQKSRDRPQVGLAASERLHERRWYLDRESCLAPTITAQHTNFICLSKTTISTDARNHKQSRIEFRVGYFSLNNIDELPTIYY